MPDKDFVVSYPCYFPLSTSDAPELIKVDGNLCICFFTDGDTMQTFQTHHHGWDKLRNVQVIACQDHETLVSTLNALRQQLDEQGVRYVALDPTPGKQIIYADLDGFPDSV
jgi:hypothetical protein